MKSLDKTQKKQGYMAKVVMPSASSLIVTSRLEMTALPANDTLYDGLEARYGSGFAQWVLDRL